MSMPRQTQSNSASIWFILFLINLMLPSLLLAETLNAPSLTTVLQAGPQVKLAWQQSNATISGFEVQRSLSSSSGFTTITVLNNSILSTVDTQVQSGNSYSYRIRCFNSGRTGVGIFNEGVWFLDTNNNGTLESGIDTAYTSFGQVGDQPVTGDWNGDGITEIGLFRNGGWYLDANGNGAWDARGDLNFKSFGMTGDLPVTGDWNGDGITEIGVFRNGKWYLDTNGDGNWKSNRDTLYPSFGQVGDLPVTGDWNGDGIAEIGVFRNGRWYLDTNGNGIWEAGVDTIYTVFGQVGDLPVCGDWNGDGKTEIGAYRNGIMYFDTNGNGRWDGTVTGGDYVFNYGSFGTLPVSGDWLGVSSANTYSAWSNIVSVNVPVAPVGDLNPPAVSIASPTSGAQYTVVQTVPITASAQDNVGVIKVDFYDGSVLKKTATAAPYKYDWALSQADNGSHSLVAKAYDAAGNVASSATVSVSVNIVDPPPATPPPVISGPVKVFPGAEGFGSDSPAGRGGKIIHVTNLNDSGSGSLREAVAASGARIVVFDVSGVIYLNSMLTISNPFITIAGQTAPGDGIMLRDYGVSIRTHDVLIQHLAIRPGDEGAGPYDTLDGMQILSPAYNVVIDHVSISWAIDENADTWTDVHDVTFSNNIISEGLRASLHSDGNHSKGYLAGRRNKNIAFIGNLLAHNDTRNPMIYGKTELLMANNVFYNAGAYSFSSIGDGWLDGPPQVSAVGNVYIKGPNTTAAAAIKLESSCPAGTRLYSSDNYFNSGSVVTGATQYLVSTPPVPISGISIVLGENNVLQKVLKNSGARPVARDAADNRIANPLTGEVVTKKGRWADCVTGCTNDAGGWPTYRVAAKVFDAGLNPSGDDNGNGYTNIEEILYQMSASICSAQ
jgi:hypothetical protein